MRIAIFLSPGLCLNIPTWHELASINLTVNETQAAKLTEPNTGIYFDWGPDQQSYYSHIDTRPENESDIEQLLEIMANKKIQPTQKTRG